jgi:peptide/nickel transport system permease protein
VTSVGEAASVPAVSELPPGRFQTTFGRGSVLGQLLRSPASAIALVFICFVLVAAVVPGLIATHDPYEADFAQLYQPPSTEHWLGTDQIGRDLFSRVIHASRRAVFVAVPATFIGCAIGLVLGLLGGYLGGRVDDAIILVSDTLLAFPALILGLAFLSILGATIQNVVALVAISLVPVFHRYMRAQVLAVKQNPFVRAEVALGAKNLRIIFSHILPNALPPLIALITISIPGAIAAEAGLAFLGLGVTPPTASWGEMLNIGLGVVREVPWPLLAPLLAISITTMAFMIVGERLQEILNPRHQTSGTQ